MTQIMIVDDSPTDTYLLQVMLEKNGYQTLTAETGNEGIEVARLFKPDLILMDVVMPEMNGFQALRELRDNCADDRGVPAYVVFSDATLLEMAAARPTSAAELLAISGVGPTKLERYGTAFLAVLRDHA